MCVCDWLGKCVSVKLINCNCFWIQDCSASDHDVESLEDVGKIVDEMQNHKNTDFNSVISNLRIRKI